MIFVEEFLDAEETPIERLECELATEAERRQHLLVERQGTSQTASHLLAKIEYSHRDLQVKIAAMTAEKNESYDWAAEILEGLMAYEANVAVQSTLREAAREDVDICMAEIAKLQERLAAKSAELSRLLAMNSGLTDELTRSKSQNADGATVMNDLKLGAGNRERFNKFAKVTRQCKKSTTTPSAAAFSAPLDEREDYKNYFEALTIESQCVSGLAAEVKKLREK